MDLGLHREKASCNIETIPCAWKIVLKRIKPNISNAMPIALDKEYGKYKELWSAN